MKCVCEDKKNRNAAKLVSASFEIQSKNNQLSPKEVTKAVYDKENVILTYRNFSKLQQCVAPFLVSVTSIATIVRGNGGALNSSSCPPVIALALACNSGGNGEYKVSVKSVN